MKWMGGRTDGWLNGWIDVWVGGLGFMDGLGGWDNYVIIITNSLYYHCWVTKQVKLTFSTLIPLSGLLIYNRKDTVC